MLKAKNEGLVQTIFLFHKGDLEVPAIAKRVMEVLTKWQVFLHPTKMKNHPGSQKTIN